MLETLFIAAAILPGGLLPAYSGFVVGPSEERLAGAKITARTACEGQNVTLQTEAISGPDGAFSIEVPESRCNKVQFQVQKDEDLWLPTGEWKEFFEATEPLLVLDTTAQQSSPLVLRVQRRGAGLTVRVTDGSSELPARVAIRRCDGRAMGWEMHTDTLDEAGGSISHVLPGGGYCVALMSAESLTGRMHTRSPNCMPIELTVGQRRTHTIRFSAHDMRRSWEWHPVECPVKRSTP